MSKDSKSLKNFGWDYQSKGFTGQKPFMMRQLNLDILKNTFSKADIRGLVEAKTTRARDLKEQ